VIINLSNLDTESFKVKAGEINGNPVFLINPADFDCKWTKDNLRFRSLLVDNYGNILSHSLRKFFNFTEKPDLYPNPENFNDLILEGKIDGSLVCVDWIFGSLNLRTRGTINYKTLENAADFDYIIQKYPNLESVARANSDDTLLFEITTPNNVIILKYENEPEIRFLGFIHKKTGLYYPAYSESGKEYVKHIGCKVPEIYKIEGSLLDINDNIKKWENKEGCVLKYGDSQNFIKFKSLQYLNLHRFKSQCNLNNLLDLFFQYDCPDFVTFLDKIEKDFDFECMVQAKSLCIQIFDTYLSCLDDIYNLKQIVEQNKDLTAKEFAIKILAEYKDNSSYLFTLRKLGELNKKDIRKLIDREIEKS
jgi:T4 RnlA family RNA ligase